MTAPRVRTCADCVEPPPPGERLEDEVTDTLTFDGLYTALQQATQPATTSFKVRRAEPRKVGRFVLLDLAWSEGHTVHQATVRMSTAMARSLAARLDKAVGRE